MNHTIRIVIEVEVESSCFEADEAEIVNNLAHLISKREYELRDCCETLFPITAVDTEEDLHPERITVHLDEIEAVIWGYQCGEVCEAGSEDYEDGGDEDDA
jgi:hypothetical protein